MEGVEVMTINYKFWKNKRVLVTGFEGFLGAHLTKELISSGAKIFGLDIKVKRKETIFTLADYRKMKIIKGNVANYSFLRRIIKDSDVQVIFHLAAEAIVEKGYRTPLRAFKSNICGTWCILEACRFARKLEAVIVASSDKAYGTHKYLPYTEDASLQGNQPYDVSKSCADLIASTYAYTYGLPVVVTRCGNIYGPGDFNFSRIVPDAIRCAFEEKNLLVRSDGKFIRDYVFVEDIVNGYIMLAEKIRELKLSGEAFNFSDEKPLSVIDLLKEINNLNFCGKKLNYKIMNTAKYEIKEQYLSSAKARRILGWEPRYSLEEGLRKTAEWYTKYLNQRERYIS